MSNPNERRSPSVTMRAAVTAVLALYGAGLVLSIVGNTGSGSSALVRTIKNRLFAPWMVPPWLDLGFDYRLTYGAEDDGAFAIEVSRHDQKKETVRLPGTYTGERGARWRRLARTIALEDADHDGLLTAAVGRGMFDDLRAEDLDVRVLRTPLPDRGGPRPGTARATAARVRMVGGELQLLRAEPPGEVAPLTHADGDVPTQESTPRAAAEPTP